MPNLSEYRDLLKRRDTLPPPSHPFQQRSALMEATHKAQTVVDHPGWQHFLDTLESRVQTLTTERDDLARRMVSGNEMGTDLERLKITLNRLDAEIKGLRYAATLIPKAVSFGQTIAGELRQAAAGRDDASRS